MSDHFAVFAAAFGLVIFFTILFRHSWQRSLRRRRSLRHNHSKWIWTDFDGKTYSSAVDPRKKGGEWRKDKEGWLGGGGDGSGGWFGDFGGGDGGDGGGGGGD